MAFQKSISLAASQIDDAITNGYIGPETSVTITDDDYDAADLLNIIDETNKTITLKYTAAWTPISANAADLVKILAQVNKYTGPLTVNGTTTTAEQLNYIAKKTTGKVTAELAAGTKISKATVDALKDVNSSDIIKFEPTQGTVSGKAELEALVALNKKLSDPNWVSVINLEGKASEIAAIKAAIKVVPSAAVDIDGKISAADANALLKASDGIVTADIKDGSVAATLKALKDVDADLQNNVLTFKSTDKTADANALVNLAKLVTKDFSSVKTITSKAADIGTDGATVIDALDKVGGANPDVAVTITGAISAKAAGAISAATDGKVTATITPDTAAQIATDLTGAISTDALNITVNGGTASVANLKLIDTQTALKVKVDAATVTATDFDAFEDIYVTGKNNFSNLGDENINVGGTLTAAQADIVAKATSKVVTAAIGGESAASVVSKLKNANAKDEFTITLTDAPTSAKDLLTLDGKTKITVDASLITEAITGTVAEVNKLLVADVTLNANPSFTLTGTVKAADANYIIFNGGAVKATIAADTAAKLDSALANAKGADQLKLTVNGATASVTELNSLAAKTAVTTDAIKVDAKEITGTGTLLAALYVDPKFANLGNENVKITEAADLDDIGLVLGATTGVVTASATDTATALLAALANATAKDKLALEVTGAATATQLLALDDKTAVKVDASAVTEVTGSAADVKKVLASKGVDVSKTTNINLSDLVVKAADVSSVAKATSGVVTATVAADTAAKLNAALTDKDENALKLTVNGTTATANDLIALDGKTSVAIALNVGAITGNITEITKVFVDSTAANFTNVGTTAATISGTITADQADAIANKTNGVVTATIKAADASTLNTTLKDADTNAYKLTVNGTTADAADLLALDRKTSLTVDAKAVKELSGDVADLKQVFAAKTAGSIALAPKINIGISDADDTAILATDLTAIKAATTGAVTVENAITISGTAAQVRAALLTPATKVIVSDVNVDITGDISAADLSAIKGVAGTGTVTVSGSIIGEDASGIAAALAEAITLNTSTIKAGDIVKITDAAGATVSSTDLNTINTKVGSTGTVVVNNAVTIKGTASDVKTAMTGLTYAGTQPNVNITDTSTVAAADIVAIDLLTTGTIAVTTATAVTGSATDVAAVIGLFNVANPNVTFDNGTTAATLAELITINGITDGTITLNDETKIATWSDSAATLAAAFNGITTLSGAVTVTGTITTPAQLDIIAKATTGVVTATLDPATPLTADTAAALASLTSSDLIIFVPAATTGDAAAINAIKAKITGVNYAALIEITSNAADTGWATTVVTSAITASGKANIAVTITGEINAAAAATLTGANGTGVLTATLVEIDGNLTNTVAAANTALGAISGDALTITVTQEVVKATDLVALSGKTTVALVAGDIQTITAESADLYSGGNVDVTDVTGALAIATGADAVELTDAVNQLAVTAINSGTTVEIDVAEIKINIGIDGSTSNDNQAFALVDLGDLSGITGLETIDALNTKIDVINLKLSDLISSNDNASFNFNIKGDAGDIDVLNVTNDLTGVGGWTTSNVNGDKTITYTQTVGTDTNTIVITIDNGTTVLA